MTAAKPNAMNKKPQVKEFDPRFKIFHELMGRKIRDVLLLSSPYDAWIMEEDCRLSERIIHEYRGLNLSNPPRLHWISSSQSALAELEKKAFDMVIIVSHQADQEALNTGAKIREKAPRLPVVLLSHNILPSDECLLDESALSVIGRTFLWMGNTDILLALIKSMEDQMNVSHDTQAAGIRVIIFVEDSPEYVSSLLPILYRELVLQTQSVMEEGLNEEHRLLAMRARPKILMAETYETAIRLYEQYEPYVLGVISDVSFPRDCELNKTAGIDLLKEIKKRRFDIPLLLTSAEASNAEKALHIPASFVDKNSDSLHADVRSFFINHLGFGDFIFRMPDDTEIARASNLQALERQLQSIPEASFVHHCHRNDFSRWLFARSEIELASIVRPIRDRDFESFESHRKYLVSIIHRRRGQRQKGVVVNLDARAFDLDTEYFKIGRGSLGGKGRGLAFFSLFLRNNPWIFEKYSQVDITIPQTLVITTEGFDLFIEKNHIQPTTLFKKSDEEIAAVFLKGRISGWIEKELKAYLSHIHYPLAVRSSSLLEDAQFKAYAGLYKTYMLPNDDPDLGRRVKQLIDAVKLVYASTYFRAPRDFARRVGHRTEEEKMAVIVQQMVGRKYGEHFYPAISGVAQSYNYYPFGNMQPEEGIATVAMGLGKTVMEGEKALRFSPKYPEVLPQRTTVDDILENAQRYFYALKLGKSLIKLGIKDSLTLDKREVTDACGEDPVRFLSSTYMPEEHRIRDIASDSGYPVLTFASILKRDLFPLAQILEDALVLGQEGMGCPVEMEFSVNLPQSKNEKPSFNILQIRPMTARAELMKVDIRNEEMQKAFLFSKSALGNACHTHIRDIVYVKSDTFDPVNTPEIAMEISRMNAALVKEERKYLLIGPGRWGSADRWLGIPVTWPDISGVGAMVETEHPKLKAEPSQGSHFFHNITTLGINYITISVGKGDYLDWNWISSLPIAEDMKSVAHVRLGSPITLKVDGRESRCVMLHEFGADNITGASIYP